jgi:hypothetical protein
MSRIILVALALVGASEISPAWDGDITQDQSTASWPNEPGGLTLVTDWGFEERPPKSGDAPVPGSPGWNVVYGLPRPQIPGLLRRVYDPGAPFSPPYVYDFVYPKGMIEGRAPATVYYPGSGDRILARQWSVVSPPRPLDADEVYVGFWWKASVPFDLGPNGNKIAFLFNGGGDTGGQQFIILMPDKRLYVLPEYPRDFRWRKPNVAATEVTLGKWHRIEWYAKLSTGTLKWWLDGALQGSHRNVRNRYRFDMFQFSPTWGGNTGARKQQTNHYWFDHVRVSVGG